MEACSSSSESESERERESTRQRRQQESTWNRVRRKQWKEREMVTQVTEWWPEATDSPKRSLSVSLFLCTCVSLGKLIEEWHWGEGEKIERLDGGEGKSGGLSIDEKTHYFSGSMFKYRSRCLMVHIYISLSCVASMRGVHSQRTSDLSAPLTFLINYLNRPFNSIIHVWEYIIWIII